MVSARARRRPNSYHHGDLRAGLVDAGIRLVEEEGVEALKLRVLERRVGVSHTAPYNHFADRTALLAAIAAEGYRRLSDNLVKRMAPFDRRPARQLQESGIAYVGFAIRHPGLFRLMFSSALADKSLHVELQTAARGTFEVLTGALGRAGAPKRRGAAEIAPLVSWALVHGLAVLVLDRQFGFYATPARAEELAREVTEVLWQGLSSGG